jgi:hypothetical protein
MQNATPPRAPLHYARMLIRAQRRFALSTSGLSMAKTAPARPATPPGRRLQLEAGERFNAWLAETLAAGSASGS